MIDTSSQHKIGEMVCFSRDTKVLGSIIGYDGYFYQVHWNGPIFGHIKDNKIVSNHSSFSINVMKDFLKELMNA
jgi:hypothetical protein